MKYIKTLACLLGLVTLSACGESDDKPDYNSNPGITVSMAQTDIYFKENKGLVNIPLVLSGETNGYVTVECIVKEYGENVAMEDVHYLLTSPTLTFDVGATSASLELKLIDDTEINEPRQFEITIVSAQGAEIGTPASTIVTIRDNDSLPYDRISGQWKLPCSDWNGNSQTVTIMIDACDDGTPGYGYYYDVYGIVTDDIPVRCDFSLNEATQVATLTIDYNQPFTYKDYKGTLCYISEDGYIINSGIVTFQWTADSPNEIVFVSGPFETYCDFVSVYKDDKYYILNDVMNVTKMVK